MFDKDIKDIKIFIIISVCRIQFGEIIIYKFPYNN